MAKKIPLRKCIGCGELKSKGELIRVIKTPDKEVVIDATGKKNGRGAYICATSSCLQRAIEVKGLERSLKTQIPEEIIIVLKKEMSEIDC